MGSWRAGELLAASRKTKLIQANCSQAPFQKSRRPSVIHQLFAAVPEAVPVVVEVGVLARPETTQQVGLSLSPDLVTWWPFAPKGPVLGVLLLVSVGPVFKATPSEPPEWSCGRRLGPVWRVGSGLPHAGPANPLWWVGCSKHTQTCTCTRNRTSLVVQFSSVFVNVRTGKPSISRFFPPVGVYLCVSAGRDRGSYQGFTSPNPQSKAPSTG